MKPQTVRSCAVRIIRKLNTFSEMTEVGIREKSVEAAEHIEMGYEHRLRSVTGKYEDIFEVTRFMMRCQEDARIRQAKNTSPDAQCVCSPRAETIVIAMSDSIARSRRHSMSAEYREG